VGAGQTVAWIKEQRTTYLNFEARCRTVAQPCCRLSCQRLGEFIGVPCQRRWHYWAEDNIRIMLENLRGEDSITKPCRKEGIAQSLYYSKCCSAPTLCCWIIKTEVRLDGSRQPSSGTATCLFRTSPWGTLRLPEITVLWPTPHTERKRRKTGEVLAVVPVTCEPVSVLL
jgi:hypothetical protein